MILDTEIKKFAEQINKLEESCNTEMCFWEGCGLKVIGAHTVSRSKHLSLIKGRSINKVYSTDYSNWKFVKNDFVCELNKCKIDKEIISKIIPLDCRFGQPISIEISIASAVPIFCNTHDKLFRSFENSDFNKTNLKQIALHAFRSHAREYFRKLEDYKSLKQLNVKINEEYLKFKSFDVNKLLFQVQQSTCSTLYGLKELDETKIKLNKIVQEGRYSELTSRVFEFLGNSTVCCSSSFSPQYTCNNIRINDPYSSTSKMEPLFLSVFAEGGNTFVVFSCFSDSENSKQFIDNIPYEIEQVKKIVSSLIITYVANAYFSLSFWDNLNGQEKDVLKNELRGTISESVRKDDKEFIYCRTNFFHD